MILRRFALLLIVLMLTFGVIIDIAYSSPTIMEDALPVPPSHTHGLTLAESVDIAGPVNPGPPCEGGSVGYHHLGARTTQGDEGAYIRLQVTNPEVRRATSDFYCSWIMIDDGVSRWIQVGWAEVGWRDDKQYVFVYDTVDNIWHFYDQFLISPGDWVIVAINYQGGTTWATWIWWGNNWVLLDVEDIGLGSPPPYTDQFGEVYTYDGYHFSIGLPAFKDTHILLNGAWDLWDTSYFTYEYNKADPYYVIWYYKYWDWICPRWGREH